MHDKYVTEFSHGVERVKFDTVFRVDESRESYEEQVDEQDGVSSRKFESRQT